MSDTATRYPPITQAAFNQACTNAQNKVALFFQEYGTKMGGIPDERGLTDQLLLELKKAMPTLVIKAYTQAKEGYTGADYMIRFDAGSQGGKRALYIQAKSIKDNNTLIDFQYKNKLAEQSDLLRSRVEIHDEDKDEKKENSIGVGGYIVYSGSVLLFLSLNDLDSAKVKVDMNSNKGVSEDARWKEVVSNIWTKRADYSLERMYKIKE
ncbi:hypothetical protein CPB86DRAFT_874567 [Serendipita vermifera]|nr:hypothetical protein CPB86DRAFT_874567 [Serendipita vermifera]